MNWKCELVMDLAPLYYDGVASSIHLIVSPFLKSCRPRCKNLITNLLSIQIGFI